MRIRPAALSSITPRALFKESTFLDAYGATVTSATPTTPTGISVGGWTTTGAKHAIGASGPGNYVTAYLLLSHPINAGDVQKIQVPLVISAIGTYTGTPSDSIVSGTFTFTCMSTPTTWNPYEITWNTRPTIDAADLHFTQDIQLLDNSSAYTLEGYTLRKSFAIDLSTQAAPIYGFALECQLTPGSQYGQIGVTTDTEFWTDAYPPKAFSVIARESLIIDGSSKRRLYLSPGSISSWWNFPYYPSSPFYGNIPAQPFFVDGVGVGDTMKTSTHSGTNYYDSDLALNLVNFAGGGFYGTHSWDATADTIDYYRNDGMIAYTEAKTACSGTVYWNL